MLLLLFFTPLQIRNFVENDFFLIYRIKLLKVDEGPVLVLLINFKAENTFIKGTKLDLQNLDTYVDFEKIKKVISFLKKSSFTTKNKLYTLTDEEINADTDYRGAIYNQIALKKEMTQKIKE